MSRTPIYLAVLFVALLIVVIAQLASTRPAPRGAAQQGVSTLATLAMRGPEPLRGAPDAEGKSSVSAGYAGGGRVVTGAPLQGWATYFDAKAGTAAAGPLLRSGDWRGRVVTVCAKACVTVRLTDWCACGSRHDKPTLIDLARADFARLAPTSQGVVWVTIGRAQLPQTDAEVIP